MSKGRMLWAAVLAACAAQAGAQNTTLAARELADLSLEQLANVSVTSVSRRGEPLLRAPASIHVISADEIRRSGARSLPEALRLAPNLQVARVNSSQYAVSARGFNSTIANKLLVLIDGRTVYTPLFSGTFWDAQDVLLEDIERIEVISGPGASLWGANAVNGVINVITRSASLTQGTLVSGGAGSDEAQLAARHGGPLGDGHYRIYAKSTRRDATALPGGARLRDQADGARAGFRADWGRAAEGLTVQGDFYAAEIDQAPQAREIDGVNLLGRWTRELGGGASLGVQAYFDHTHRRIPTQFEEDLDTYDIEMQHALERRGRHRLLWGAGARRHDDRIVNSPSFAFFPASRTLNQTQLFVQDEISLREGFELTLGAKAEHNSYSGTEFLPSARLAWQASPHQLLWTAVSRAVRAPSRLDRELFVPGVPPFTTVAGGPAFRSEVSRVYELGYRAQAAANVSFSITAFHHDHEHLRTIAPAPGGPVFANDLEGRTTGIEAWGTWRPADWWRLDAGMARLDQSLKLRPGATDLQAATTTGADPDGWGKLRAAFDLGNRAELDFMLRYYGRLESSGVPSYTALDARLGWHLQRNVEVSLLLQNVLDEGHVEWLGGSEFERGAFLKLKIGL